MCKGTVTSEDVNQGGFVNHAKSVLKGVLKKGSAEKYRLLPDEEETGERVEQSKPGISEDDVTIEPQSPANDQAENGPWRCGNRQKITWGDEQGGQLKFVKEFDQYTPILGNQLYDTPKYQLYTPSKTENVQYAPEAYWISEDQIDPPLCRCC
uniref:Uncharacterized protein n=1 Tax=Pyramimonas obovata TaxID=1411642 RepID=A0A7S0REW0_9CHLO|mmetsp:Transcript_32629/g.71293  ORF Transcript_32629/g.71293 Transcript_32629/m.71293 type:complete len:153 (+) Transcript_32629:98-556(+)